MSTKLFGCFFCSGKSKNKIGQCDKCGTPIDVSNDLLGADIERYVPIEVIGRGFYGWTLKVKDKMQLFAMKIIPWHRLEASSEEIDREAKALVSCSTPPHRHIAKFWQAFKTTIKVLGQEVEVLCMVFEYIPKASPLREIIESETIQLTRGDIVDILAGIASGLERMHSRGLWHNDLHDDNVLVRSVEADENLHEKYESKLIDFGSVKPKRVDEPERGERGDYFYLSKHILGLVARFEYFQMERLSSADRVFASRFRVLARRLSDTNISRRDLEPREICAEIRKVGFESVRGYRFRNFDEMAQENKVTIKDPLENANALNLSIQDVALLFKDSLGWQDLLTSSETVVVVGPRGCGKTMLLRYLSIPSQARPRKGEKKREEVAHRLDELSYVGFLISCQDLRTPFIRSGYKKLEAADSARAQDFCREFINMHFAIEVARTLSWVKEEKLASIEDDDLKPLASLLAGLLGSNRNGQPGDLDLEGVVEDMERRAINLSNLADPASYIPSNLCRDDILVQMSEALKVIPWAKSKQIWFLLDDYTETVLPIHAQRAYNPVVFKVSGKIRVKVSSEGDGPILEDELMRKYKEGRELSKVNLGETYFNVSERHGQKFVEEILDVRFRETGKGSLEELKNLLGEHPHEEKFGSYICKSTRPGDSRFFGFGLLCKLCSGDVSFIIRLFRCIIAGQWGTNKGRIPEIKQDETTKKFARRQLENLRSTPDYGPKLHEIANNLGWLIKEYLLKSRNKDTADERLRIEIEGGGDLSADAEKIHRALLQHSVLIKGGSGKDRTGMPTQQFFFRRLFAPCFPFSPLRKGCIPVKIAEYELWLTRPEVIRDKLGADDWENGLGKGKKAK